MDKLDKPIETKIQKVFEDVPQINLLKKTIIPSRNVRPFSPRDWKETKQRGELSPLKLSGSESEISKGKKAGYSPEVQHIGRLEKKVPYQKKVVGKFINKSHRTIMDQLDKLIEIKIQLFLEQWAANPFPSSDANSGWYTGAYAPSVPIKDRRDIDDEEEKKEEEEEKNDIL